VRSALIASGLALPARHQPERDRQIILETSGPALDLADIKGQESAKRALEVAAAGGHNLHVVLSMTIDMSLFHRSIRPKRPPIPTSQTCGLKPHALAPGTGPTQMSKWLIRVNDLA
jgi:predicted ATPase with chaperone activity